MDIINIPKACIIKVESKLYKDLLVDSLINMTRDLNHMLEEEISKRLIENVPLNDFMGTFMKSSEYKDLVTPLLLY